MVRYKKVLVAIDGSENSFQALKESFKIVACEKCWVSAVSVIPDYKGDLDLTVFGNVNVLDSIKAPYVNSLNRAKEIAQQNNVILKTILEEGDPFERIVDLADGENYDLILIGRKGLKDIERILMGSVTARVIGYSNKDVMVFPENSQIRCEKILVPVDGSKFSLNALEKAIEISISHKSELHIISIVDMPVNAIADSPELYKEIIQKTKKNLEASNIAVEKGITPVTEILEGSPYNLIVDYAKKHNINMIVIGSHGKTGLKRLMMGSVTESVINMSECPVLVVKS